MTNPFTTLYFISAGVLCMVAGYTAWLGQGSNTKTAFQLLALICLSFSGVQVFSAIQYKSLDLADVVAAHKCLNLFSILVFPLTSWLIAALEGRDARRWIPLLLSAGSVVLIVHNVMAPYGYRFAFLAPDLRRSLPWGEQVSILSGLPSDAQMLMQLVVFGLGIQLALFTRRLHRQHQILFSGLMWIAIVLLLLTSTLSKYSDAGVLHMPYLGGFAFTVLALLSLYLKAGRSFAGSQLSAAQRMHSMLDHQYRQPLAYTDARLSRDSSTGLRNRAGILSELGHLDAQGLAGAMLSLELDRFDVIGGTKGDGTREQLMKAAARRILDVLEPAGKLARVGNNRFALFVPAVTSAGQARALYQQLTLVFLAPFPIADASWIISISVGIALYPADQQWQEATPERLLEAAEMALHEARSGGGNKYCFYHPELEQTLQEEVAFENALSLALAKKDFSLYYQPQVAAQDERPVCVEALLRWHHPGHGFIEPGKFIPVAEAMGIIGSVGAWVIENACAQLAALRAAGHGNIRVAINVSTQQLMLPELEQDLRDCLRRFDLDPAAIELEVTESLVMRMPELAIARLEALRELGVRLAIDDFGTGYSSLAYLQMLPVHAIKLDRSFIPDIENSQRALSICRNAIQMGRDLGLEVVAEGVETARQAQALRDLGCDLLQGYYYAKPLSAEELPAYLAQWPGPANLACSVTSLPG